MWLAAIAGNHKELSVVDPVSKTEFHFEKAVVLDSSDTKFLKFTLELQNSYVYIYSMKSNDGEIFSWNRLNEFDAGNKYGTLIKREKINDFDGWIRYYETQKNGVKYINCVSIIRGKKYAIYLFERAFNIEQLATPKLVHNTKFKDISKTDFRVSQVSVSYEILFWIMLILSLVIFSILHINLNVSYKLIYVLGAIVLVAAIVLSYTLFAYSVFGIFLLLLFYGISVFYVGLSDSWSEFFKFVKCVVEKIGS